MMSQRAGKTALVTGTARGIGRAVALALAVGRSPCAPMSHRSGDAGATTK